MKATVTYWESTDKTHMLRLAFPSGSAHFEVPKEDVVGDVPAVGDEVEVLVKPVPKPKPVEETKDDGAVPVETAKAEETKDVEVTYEPEVSHKSTRPHR